MLSHWCMVIIRRCACISALLTLSFHRLFRRRELTFSEHAITVNNVHTGATKASIILPLSKANHTSMLQQVTVNVTNTACPVTALTTNAKSCPPKPGQFFIKLNGSPVLQQDIASILTKLANFLNLPHQLIKLHSLRIGGSTLLYLLGHDLQYIQQKGRWASQAFKHYICC